ncbi:histidine kinase [Sphaerisporangium corydalis]|uniref:histidine kinase n=1 Tax=Sphaerisporangium corydalis TaxID=1441875 RepID=A0ABV9E6Z7_9ACTN|nr:histidine kinase [Sphaerisporangium corydalis]
MFTRTALEAVTRPPAAFLRSSWPWRSLAYLLSSVPLAALASGVVYAAVEFGVAIACAAAVLAVVVLGPVLAWFERVRLRLVDLAPVRVDRTRSAGPRAGLTARRARQASLPGTRVRQAAHPGTRARQAARSRARVAARLAACLRDQATWRAYGFVTLALGVMWVVDLGMVSLATWIPLVLLSGPLQPDIDLATGLALAAAGIVLLPLSAYLMTAWAGARAMITRAVLAPADAEVVRSRARLVDAFESERRRIERDLHDGAQQRLVALSMKLGLAKLDLPPGSPAAAQLDEAHEEAKKALAELRELIRGVHPQVLTDRGLPAAVLDVAGRSPVPADVDLVLPVRPPVPVEVTAYYVVCEALANVAKHSGATRCSVRGRLVGGTLVLEVGDDGIGGADPEAGSGLAGLADRVAVADGVMTLSSPPGGPTSLRVELPCPAPAPAETPRPAPSPAATPCPVLPPVENTWTTSPRA